MGFALAHAGRLWYNDCILQNCGTPASVRGITLVTIGIDIGGSTTKIVGFASKNTAALIEPLSVRATDPVTDRKSVV